MRADSLEKGLQRRPTADELMQKGILESEWQVPLPWGLANVL